MKCHALSIEIGNQNHVCENADLSQPSGSKAVEGGGEVRMCSASPCIFNESGHCAARAIHVVLESSAPLCGTFRDKSYLDD
jgi:hypothetical protein